MNKIIEEIRKLSREEQLEIAHAIWDLAYHEEEPLLIDQGTEARWFQKKMDAQEKTPENVLTWDQMRDRMVKRL